jgi:UDP-N-acetylmuramate dehydrogenase
MDEKFKKQFMKQKEEIKKIFGDRVKFNESLSKFSWFNVGGPAELFFRADSEEELSIFFKYLNSLNKQITIIGAGSNTLIRDGGVKGATIKLSSKFSYLKLIEESLIEAGAATFDKKLSEFSKENSIAGLEFLSCIPGSVGGAIKMNAGWHGHSIENVVASIKVMDFEGNIKEIEKSEISFFYRGSSLPNNLLILSAKFKGKLSKKENIEKKLIQLTDKKKASQPSGVKTCGSTFKNPENKKAWQLIKESDCDKLSVGGAKISEKHCNFLINEGNANSREIEELINNVKKKVLIKTGVKMELEIKIIGTKT